MTPPTRRTARYFPSQAGSGPALRAFLFTRDLPLGVIPNRYSRTGTGFSITLEPQSDETAAWLTEFLAIGQHRPRTLADAVEDFVETTVSFLAYGGEVFFELADPMADSPRPDLPSELCPLPPGPVHRLPGRYLQLVPRADRAAFGGHRYLTAPADRMWRMRLPEGLGTPRQHRRMLKQMTRLSEMMPDFALQTPDLGRSQSYDFSTHRRAVEIALERATNRWGTIPSLFRVDGSSEYYLFARRIRWKWSQALLREHIIRELNTLLGSFGVVERVVVSGLRTPDEIAVVARQLHSGEIDVAEAIRVDEPKAATPRVI